MNGPITTSDHNNHRHAWTWHIRNWNAFEAHWHGKHNDEHHGRIEQQALSGASSRSTGHWAPAWQDRKAYACENR